MTLTTNSGEQTSLSVASSGLSWSRAHQPLSVNSGSRTGSGTYLRGRSSECARLDDLISAIRGGESRALVLKGEAGIGKTALLEYLVESAKDLTLLRADGVESEMELAYAGLHQLCAPLLGQLNRLVAPQRQVLEVVFGLSAGMAPDRLLVGLAVLSLLCEVAEDHPLLCVVDDAQWLDQASALTLAFVARRLLTEPVGIVFAAREPPRELQHVTEMRVHGLSNADARAVLGSALRSRLDERVRDRIIAETGGNPLALLELPRAYTPAQVAGGFGLLEAQSLSKWIEDSFLRRLETLSDDSRRLALLAAAEPVGDPLLLWDAARRLDIGPSAADDLGAQELLVIGERVTFRHPLVRSAVYQSATPQERRTAHSALAQATDPGTDPDRRAWHLAAAVAGTDDEVAQELERSACRAQARGGLAAAAAFLQRAVALTGDPGRRADRALAAAEANLQAGAFDAARSLVATVESGPLDELRRGRVELLHGQVAMFSAPGPDAASLLLRAAQQLEHVDPRLARDTYLDAWGAALFAGRLNPRSTLFEVSRAARSAPRPHDAPRPSDLLLDSLATLVLDGRAAAAPLLAEVTRIFAHEQTPPTESLRWGWLTVVPTYVLWDEEAAHSLCGRQLATLRDAGALARLPLDLKTFSLLALRCGDLAGAAAASAETHAVTEATGMSVAPVDDMMLAVVRGHEAEARALIQSTKRDSLALGQGVHVQLADWMLALLCNGLGHYDEALAAAQQASNDSPEEIFVSAWATVELLEAATRSDNPEWAHIALGRIVSATSVARTDSALGIEARCRALMTEGATAEHLYREAVDRLGRSRLRPELARAHLLYGEWLRRQGRRVDARDQLRTAYDQCSSIGMEAFGERARKELLATGEHVRRRAVDTQRNLTAQEQQIAQLASTGLSNPEIGTRLFISPHTVEYHLGKVFPKLGITSRKQLAGALRASVI
jgi:DNA-binding CsgD family transcriptional regulator